MMRSESTSALGQPRLTKLTRGAFIVSIGSFFSEGGHLSQAGRQWYRNSGSQTVARIATLSEDGAGQIHQLREKLRVDDLHPVIDHLQRDVEDDRQADVADPAVAM